MTMLYETNPNTPEGSWIVRAVAFLIGVTLVIAIAQAVGCRSENDWHTDMSCANLISRERKAHALEMEELKLQYQRDTVRIAEMYELRLLEQQLKREVKIMEMLKAKRIQR